MVALGPFGDWYGPTGINPNAPPPVVPKKKSDLMDKLNSPLAQIGLQLLANSRGENGRPTKLGPALGRSVLGYQQQVAEGQQADLQRKLLEAQIAKMRQPDQQQEPSQLVLLKALQANPELLKIQQSMGASSTPSSVQEWEYFQKLSPEMQKQFLNMKRQPAAPQLAEIGGVQSLVDRIGGTVKPLSTVEAEAAAQGTLAAGKAAGQVRGEALGGVEKKGIQAESTLSNLDLADPLIDAATGSLAGAARDRLAAVFGEAPTGAQAIAQLKVLQANLMTSMPRMEGPQSDKDVALYREAAGQIGDPTVPRATKKAALNIIRQINERYASKVSGGASISVGEVRKGYRFKGGDPSQQSSWEKVP